MSSEKRMNTKKQNKTQVKEGDRIERIMQRRKKAVKTHSNDFDEMFTSKKRLKINDLY
jgi:hypothetical protein